METLNTKSHKKHLTHVSISIKENEIFIERLREILG